MNIQAKGGIWTFPHFLVPFSSDRKITLGECHTPLIKSDNIFFKCDFKNPTGSWKDRGMVYQISKLLEAGIKEAVISSSGNAAISAASYCKIAHIKLTVFVSPKINPYKLDQLNRLLKSPSQIIQTPKPLSASIQYAKKKKVKNLRQSTDPNATIGYRTLSYELHNEIPEVDAVFLPVSSGTALVGLAEGFIKLGYLPAIHPVQTETVHPIASLFDKEFQKTDKSLADAIVARFTPREKQILHYIKRSKGCGWVISDEKIREARKWLFSSNLNCSYEGAAALAALWKAKEKSYQYKNPVCLLSGKYYG